MGVSRDYVIKRGSTFSDVVRWETDPIVYKAITAITQTAPVRLTVPGHGMPDGWAGAVTNVKGMTEINAEANKVRESDYYPVTVIDADTVEINAINAAGFKAYVSGGYLQYNTPVDLTDFTAREDIKDKVGGTVLHSLTTENGGLAIDPTAKTIKRSITAANTAAFSWAKGVSELEMVSGDAVPVVTAILRGKVSVSDEVTT